MLIVIVILLVVLALSLFSEIHALGAWFWLLMTHGLLIDVLGDSAEHMPMAAGLIIVTVILLRRKWSIVSLNALTILGLLCLTMTAAAIVGLNPADSMVNLVLYWKGFMLAFLIAGYVKTDTQIELLTKYCLAGVTIGVFVTFYEFVSGSFEVDTVSIQRAGSLHGDPNVSAALLSVGVPLAIFWAVHTKRRLVAIACLSLVGLIFASITLTQSRGGFVALMLILVLMYMRKPSLKGLFFGTIIMSIGVWFASADYWDRISLLANPEEEAGRSLHLRTHIFLTGIKIFLENPAMGVGIGNFGQALVDLNPAAGADAKTKWVAHNMYLEFFAENGVFGGLLLLTLLAYALFQAVTFDKLNPSEKSVYGIGFCVAMASFSILTSGLFLSLGKQSVLWFLVGLCLAFKRASDALKIQSRGEIQGGDYLALRANEVSPEVVNPSGKRHGF